MIKNIELSNGNRLEIVYTNAEARLFNSEGVRLFQCAFSAKGDSTEITLGASFHQKEIRNMIDLKQGMLKLGYKTMSFTRDLNGQSVLVNLEK